jgi:hypothetical protein
MRKEPLYHMTKTLQIFLFTLLCTLNTLAQSPPESTASGFVLDATTREPLPYATVVVKGSTLGTVTNLKGAFKLSLPTNLKSDSLSISFMGYKSQTVAVSRLSSNNTIYLRENELLLNEVQVTGQTGLSILKKAIQQIPVNYYAQPYHSKGFYRVTSKRDAKYMHLSEAVFELHHATKASQFKLVKMRAIKDERESHGLDLGLKPASIIEFDIVNHRGEFDFLSEKGLKNYTIALKGKELYLDQEVVVLTFDQKEGVKKAGYKGKILIDTQTFAIVYLDYGFSPKGIHYYKYGDAAQRALMKMLDIHIGMTASNYQISYKRIGDRYYLSSVYNDAVLTFRSSRNHYNFVADTQVDYIATDIDLTNTVPFTDKETLGNSKLIEEQDSPYDESFWEGHNVILPNTDFTAIAKTIAANNQANNTRL